MRRSSDVTGNCINYRFSQFTVSIYTSVNVSLYYANEAGLRRGARLPCALDSRFYSEKFVASNVSDIGGSIYEKNPPNPKKIDTKGFSIVFGTFRHAK